MRAPLLCALVAAAPAASAAAQTMDHHMMPGMSMPGMAMPARKPPARPKPAARTPPAKKPRAGPALMPVADPPAGRAMSAMPGMPGMPGMAMPADGTMSHATAAMPAMAATATGTDLAPGDAPAPAPAPDLAASRFYGEAAMRAADRALRREHGGMTYHQVLFNLAEYRARKSGDGYRWDGEAWIGGDIDRLAVKSEGEGRFGAALEHAEIRVLYSRALDPYWNLQTGVRYDVGTGPSRGYATIGIEGLAPYWFDVEGALFLSDKGDVLGRIEAWHDARVTQVFVLQPRIEANVAAQDVPRDGIGSGLTDLELGLRLRYEKSRQFAPYVGLSWERQFGDTARATRMRGGDTGGLALVAGIRTWF